MNQDEHMIYLNRKGKFKLECSTKIFSNIELDLLVNYGHWFEGLISGELEPYTFPQEHFIEVFSNHYIEDINKDILDNIAEEAWWKYKYRILIEEENSFSDNVFSNREDLPKLDYKRISYAKPIKVTNKDFSILRRIGSKVDLFFENTFSVKVARSTDIFQFIKNTEVGTDFNTQREFNKFLRKMFKSGVLNQVIPNIDVDDSNMNNYNWFFYRIKRKRNKAKKKSIDYKNNNLLLDQRTTETIDGTYVRSRQEKIIYEILSTDNSFDTYYELKLNKKGILIYPDFVIKRKIDNKVFIWEHFGMTENVDYDNGINIKIEKYKSLNYEFIENNGTLIITYFLNEEKLIEDIYRLIKLIKEVA